MKQLICSIWFPFQSLEKVGEICKTLSVLDWNINMFLHFRQVFKMLPSGRNLLAWNWYIYIMCTCSSASSNYWELLVFLEIECSFLKKFCKITVFRLCDQVQCKWLYSVRTDWIHCHLATMNIADVLIPKSTEQ